MRRALCVWLPEFPIDLLRRRDRRRAGPPDGRAVLLAGRVGQRRVVMRCCGRASAAGVRAGMPLSEARALLSPDGFRVEPFTPDRDAAALRAVAVWGQRFSPIVAPDPPDSLCVDITGCAPVFGGEEALGRRSLADLGRLGLTARVAIASAFGCAGAVARHAGARLTIIPPGAEREAIAGLPLAALRLEEAAVAALNEVGIERVGQLLALPRASVYARFGAEPLQRIDKASAQTTETIEPIRPVIPPSAAFTLDGPTTRTEAIEHVTRRLLNDLMTHLGSRQRGVRRLDIELIRVDAESVRLVIRLCRPSRSERHLWSLLRPRLERVNLGFGVERIRLTAARTDLLRHEQMEHWRSDADRARIENERVFGELVDVLTDRLGADRVLLAGPVETHRPEHAFRMVPLSTDGARGQERVGVAPGDRPSLLLDRPRPVRVVALTPDGPVMSVSLDGREHRVITSIGPERIGPQWWRGEGATRDYFKVQQADGRWLWIFRQLPDGRWFTHGVWA